MPFKLAALTTGNDPDDWATLESIDIEDPDWTYQPFAEVVGTLSGRSCGRGFASATWHINAMHNVQRSALRTICPDASVEVYISTPTNEDDSNGDPIFKNYRCTMHWMQGQEDKQTRHTLGIDLTFTHLVEVV